MWAASKPQASMKKSMGIFPQKKVERGEWRLRDYIHCILTNLNPVKRKDLQGSDTVEKFLKMLTNGKT